MKVKWAVVAAGVSEHGKMRPVRGGGSRFVVAGSLGGLRGLAG